MFKNLARLEKVDVIRDGDTVPLSVKQLVGSMELMIPMADFIDVDAEKKRVLKQREKLEQDIKRIEGKLGNAHFVAKAPAAVVEKEKAKSLALERNIEKLNEQLHQLDQVSSS